MILVMNKSKNMKKIKQKMIIKVIIKLSGMKKIKLLKN